MIGIFILDEIPKVNKQLVLGHSKINDGISGYFYFRENPIVQTFAQSIKAVSSLVF